MHPLATTVVVLGIAALPAVVAERSPEPSRARVFAERWRRGLIVVGIAWALVALLRFAASARPTVGSLDFYHYVCFGRDLAAGHSDVPIARHAYFPGSFAAWRLAISVLGTDLARLQTFYLCVFALDALLVGLLVGRVARSVPAGFAAALWYLALASRLMALHGDAEPLVTLPFLVGLNLWAGEPLRRGRGWLRTVALGTALGLTLFVKQQGGLLSLGALALLPAARFGPEERRHSLAQLAALPLVAVAAFFVALWLEVGNLEPLRLGLGLAARYPGQGPDQGSPPSFAINLTQLVWHHAKPLLPALALVLAVAAGQVRDLFTPSRREGLGERWVAVASFAAVAALASLIQLSRRPYPHYLLLTAPSIAIAGVLALAHVVPARPLGRYALVALAALALARTGRVENPYYAPWPPGPELAWEAPWDRRPHHLSDIASLGTAVRAGEDVLVLPLHRDLVHHRLGSRSRAFPLGYGPWEPELGFTLDDVRWAELDAVVVFTRLEHQDKECWERFATTAAVRRLPERGFRPVVVLPTITLWRRAP